MTGLVTSLHKNLHKTLKYLDHIAGCVIEHNRIDMLKMLVENFNYDVRSGGNRAIRTCCRYNHPEMLQLLIDYGADVHVKGRVTVYGYDGPDPEITKRVRIMAIDCPILLSCLKGHYDTTKVLLDNGVDPNTRDGAVFYLALQDIKLTKLFIDYGASVNIDSSTLIEAVKKKDLEMVNLLLDAGADINVINEYASATQLDDNKYKLILSCKPRC